MLDEAQQPPTGWGHDSNLVLSDRHHAYRGEAAPQRPAAAAWNL